MEAKLAELLDKLSTKLGVAVDVLWAALLKQAVIAAITDLIVLGLVAYAGVWVVRYVKLCHKNVQERDWDEIAWLPCALVVVAYSLFVVGGISSLPMIFAGFFNPEYWALMKIIGK